MASKLFLYVPASLAAQLNHSQSQRAIKTREGEGEWEREMGNKNGNLPAIKWHFMAHKAIGYEINFWRAKTKNCAEHQFLMRATEVNVACNATTRNNNARLVPRVWQLLLPLTIQSSEYPLYSQHSTHSLAYLEQLRPLWSCLSFDVPQNKKHIIVYVSGLYELKDGSFREEGRETRLAGPHNGEHQEAPSRQLRTKNSCEYVDHFTWLSDSGQQQELTTAANNRWDSQSS